VSCCSLPNKKVAPAQGSLNGAVAGPGSKVHDTDAGWNGAFPTLANAAWELKKNWGSGEGT
jgi:hypothetical protein